MAFLFQLLSENDLRDLGSEELEHLKAVFYHTLYTNETIRRELAITVSQTLQRLREQREQADPEQS
jgi:hypothetical protein